MADASSSKSVKISVESNAEWLVQEVALGGQEIYVQPLSMSEHLTTLAQKIDFTEEETDVRSHGGGGGGEPDKEPTAFDQRTWPWAGVCTKLRGALTEMSVLNDVLNVAKEKRYVVLDPIISPDLPTAQQQQQNLLHLLSKRRTLAGAAATLLHGADCLYKTSQVDTVQGVSRSTSDFYKELLALRQHWRLKKSGQNVIGDLSFRSAGSRFWQTGVFEVHKGASDQADGGSVAAATSAPDSGGQDGGGQLRSALRVVVPPDLEGHAFVQVVIQHRDVNGRFQPIISASSKDKRLLIGKPAANLPWQAFLEGAQNVLFCKELFSQLAQEAVHLRSSVPHVVVGNQILCQILPGYQLAINLCHAKVATDKEPPEAFPHRHPKHSHVLEHALHHILRELHQLYLNQCPPHPVSAPMGLPKKRRLAGPHAISRQDLSEFQNADCHLERILKQSRHIVLRKRAVDILDEMTTVSDPSIMVHWSVISDTTESSVKVQVRSHGYEHLCRTPLQLIIGVDKIRAVWRGGRVVCLSPDEQELRDLLTYLISQHQITVAHSLAKSMGWVVLQYNPHVGTGPVEESAHAAILMLSSATSNTVVSIRHGPGCGTKVWIRAAAHGSREECRSNVIKDQKWGVLSGEFKSIDWTKLQGSNFANKVELLLASLAG